RRSTDHERADLQRTLPVAALDADHERDGAQLAECGRCSADIALGRGAREAERGLAAPSPAVLISMLPDDPVHECDAGIARLEVTVRIVMEVDAGAESDVLAGLRPGCGRDRNGGDHE